MLSSAKMAVALGPSSHLNANSTGHLQQLPVEEPPVECSSRVATPLARLDSPRTAAATRRAVQLVLHVATQALHEARVRMRVPEEPLARGEALLGERQRDGVLATLA